MVMLRSGWITKNVVLGFALAFAVALAPRMAAADRDHRDSDRRDGRYERHDGRRHEGRDDRHMEHRYDRHEGEREGRRHDRDRERWEHPRGRVVIRIGGPPVVYCPPPPPVYEYYDPYCHTTYASLALFSAHALRHGHLSFVWVMEGGRPRYASRYAHDRWQRCDEWWPRDGWGRHCD
jgi:hypothetical protein